MKWILMLDVKLQANLLINLINTLLSLCQYSANSIKSSFYQGFKFLQFNYEENEKFKPIYNFFLFIERVDQFD